ncbi:hypothetical protein ADK64_37590 [Streptomyces sp. MMG1121]|nr:hypothetical protein ADK64_37590 [Streptomyces sp. MMG1121]
MDIGDRDDFTIAELHLRALFPDNETVPERTRMVKNRDTNPHAPVEYPKHWQSVAPLAELLWPAPGLRRRPAQEGRGDR